MMLKEEVVLMTVYYQSLKYVRVSLYLGFTKADLLEVGRI